MSRLLTFDLDNTLWDVEPIVERAERVMHDYLSTRLALWQQRDDELLKASRRAAWQAHPEQHHNLTFMRIAVLERALQALGLTTTEAQRLAREGFAAFHRERNKVELFPHAETMLQTLAKEHRLIALSNGNADIRQMPISPYFHAHFSAEMVGAAKPHRQLFDAALQHAQAAAEHSIHIGDHPEQDIAAAKAVGMQTVWVNLTQQQWPLAERPDAEIHCLSELPPIIAALTR